MFVVLCKNIINNGLSACILLCVAKHAKRAIMQFADNTGPDHPALLRKLIWASIVRLQNQRILWYMSTNREYPDQTARKPSSSRPSLFA